ncbi:MAG: Hint domain-containing protein [Sulfitobacter sp.]
MSTIAAPGFTDPRKNNPSMGFTTTTDRKRVLTTRAPIEMPKRSYEMAGLRSDGSLYIGQTTAPALPLFESAFSAFGRGTLIQTTMGPVAVEDLQPGDMINTATGEAAQLVWIGSSSFAATEHGRRTPLIRIMADSFGESRPERFVTLGPGARILQTPPALRGLADGKQLLSPAQAFVDGVNVIEVVPPTPVRLFHLCLTRHAVINVGGIQMETFHPGMAATRKVSHALRDRFLSMFPRMAHVTDFGPLAHARAPEEDEDLVV